jgi:hypothetical protein
MINDQKTPKRLVFKLFLITAFMFSCNEDLKKVTVHTIEYRVGIIGAPCGLRNVWTVTSQ